MLPIPAKAVTTASGWLPARRIERWTPYTSYALCHFFEVATRVKQGTHLQARDMREAHATDAVAGRYERLRVVAGQADAALGPLAAAQAAHLMHMPHG